MESRFSAPVRVLIVDRHAMVREGLRALLDAQSDVEVVGDTRGGADAVAAAAALAPDVVLLDVALPGFPGPDVMRQLTQAGIPSLVILLSTDGTGRSDIQKALKLGARGVVAKESSIEVLLRAIRAVHAGDYWLGRDVIADLVDAEFTGDSPAGPPDPRNTFGLTPRELELVSLVAAGCSNKEIAERCRIREDTVKHHLSSIFDKTGMSSRVELALFALRNSLASGS